MPYSCLSPKMTLGRRNPHKHSLSSTCFFNSHFISPPVSLATCSLLSSLLSPRNANYYLYLVSMVNEIGSLFYSTSFILSSIFSSSGVNMMVNRATQPDVHLTISRCPTIPMYAGPPSVNRSRRTLPDSFPSSFRALI